MRNAQLNKNIIMMDYFLREGENGEKYFDICGAKLPDIRNDSAYMDIFWCIFSDTFFVPFFFNDNHSADVIRLLDIFMTEGPYGYKDKKKNFDVTVNSGDIVIDAGAWIGDFSAYAANKGARVFAFEPDTKTFRYLERTAALNRPQEINVSRYALADSCTEMELFQGCDTGNRHLKCSNKQEIASETISTITLDEFVRLQNLDHIDFIKADIEGAERRLLAGAHETIRKFSPKIVLCTYHSVDDPEILEKIILEINPAYKIIQLQNKLFACVSKSK